MRRLTFSERPHWQKRLEEAGFTWYAPTPEHPVPYWGEEACYLFNPAQITQLQRSSQQMTDLVMQATDYAITHGRLTELGIPTFLHNAIRASWERDDPTIYMRLDIAWDGTSTPPKLIEVNAQTPTSLIEASISQWQWLEDRQEAGQLPAQAGQWNTIHEALSEQWHYLQAARGVRQVHFCSGRLDEDIATVTYLRDLAQAASISTSFLAVDEVGSNPESAQLLDTWNLPIHNLMWLWPFEFAWESTDAPYVASTSTRFIEPLWKAVTGSKGLLALVHELNPGHPLLLPATLQSGGLGPDVEVVRKPLYSREGQNVQLPGEAATPGDYADLPLVEQQYTILPSFETADGPRYPILGTWIAGDEVCGLGIREGRGRVTDNRATFVPHVVLPES